MSPERKPQSEQCYVYYIQQSKTKFILYLGFLDEVTCVFSPIFLGETN